MSSGDNQHGHKFKVLTRLAKATRISSGDKGVLSESLGVVRTEPDKVVIMAPKVPEKPKEEDPFERLKESREKYEKWLKAAGQMKQLLAHKMKDRKVKVPVSENLAVRDAIRRIFGKDTAVITHEMFAQALKIRSEILQEERKKDYGTS